MFLRIMGDPKNKMPYKLYKWLAIQVDFLVLATIEPRKGSIYQPTSPIPIWVSRFLQSFIMIFRSPEPL